MLATAPCATPLPSRSDADLRPNRDGASFGAALRSYRLAAGLSQEALAERANLSARAIRALELGERRAPYAATVDALADGLELAGSERAALKAAVLRSRVGRAADGSNRRSTASSAPLSPTSLLGRARELAIARNLLQSEAVRLLTLTGPGGVGKTRLALEVARELRAAFPGGVYFVDLAPLRDEELLLHAVAQVLGVAERGDQLLLAALQDHLSGRQVLLVLDTFEQLLAGAPRVAELLMACPRLKVLITSRTRLRLRWEHTLQIQPLRTPDQKEPLAVETLGSVPAVALFVERARANYPAFALTPQNAAAVAALCRHLEGLPLAIELAAARANVLSPAEMLTWARQRLPVLRWDAPDLPPRQQSLRATLEWSYALLSPGEQALFRRVGVFPDGWTCEAAEAVTVAGELGLDTLEGLSRLIDASLVEVRESGHAGRFFLSETAREFAAEQLDKSGERAATEGRYAACCLVQSQGEAAAPKSTKYDPQIELPVWRRSPDPTWVFAAVSGAAIHRRRRASLGAGMSPYARGWRATKAGARRRRAHELGLARRTTVPVLDIRATR